jgi:hypothetical protein
MSYDLRRLRRRHLVTRHPGTNTWALTADGAHFALFYSKVHNRVLTPLCAADLPPAPTELSVHALAGAHADTNVVAVGNAGAVRLLT